MAINRSPIIYIDLSNPQIITPAIQELLDFKTQLDENRKNTKRLKQIHNRYAEKLAIFQGDTFDGNYKLHANTLLRHCLFLIQYMGVMYASIFCEKQNFIETCSINKNEIKPGLLTQLLYNMINRLTTLKSLLSICDSSDIEGLEQIKEAATSPSCYVLIDSRIKYFTSLTEPLDATNPMVDSIRDDDSQPRKKLTTSQSHLDQSSETVHPLVSNDELPDNSYLLDTEAPAQPEMTDEELATFTIGLTNAELIELTHGRSIAEQELSNCPVMTKEATEAFCKTGDFSALTMSTPSNEGETTDVAPESIVSVSAPIVAATPVIAPASPAFIAAYQQLPVQNLQEITVTNAYLINLLREYYRAGYNTGYKACLTEIETDTTREVTTTVPVAQNPASFYYSQHPQASDQATSTKRNYRSLSTSL